MFYCENCNKVFDEPKAVDECIGEYWGTLAFETFYYCPHCDDEAILEITDLDDYDDPILVNEYYYEVSDGDGKYLCKFSANSMKEHFDEIFEDKCVVERKFAKRR